MAAVLLVAWMGGGAAAVPQASPASPFPQPGCNSSWELFRSGYEVDVDRLRWPELMLRIPPPKLVSPCSTLGLRHPLKAWALRSPLLEPRRNHDCRLLGERLLVNVLGRYGRSVEVLDLRTGRGARYPVDGVDPAGWPLNDLNHVYGVRARALNGAGDELWLICGFHGDRVNDEIASQYARIVDLRSFQVRLGPKLPRAGGACAALALHLDGADAPPHICSFGGTEGSHSAGTFIDTAHCYDRRRRRWHSPFAQLPRGLDHANAAYVRAGMCGAGESARVLLLNYRVDHYANYRSEVLAHDLWEPADGARAPRKWYTYAAPVSAGGADRTRSARDASGLVSAAGGRYLLNFGGVHYSNTTRGADGALKRRPWVLDNVRAFDVCAREWQEVSDLGMPLLAVQTCASATHGVAITCGGTGPVSWPATPWVIMRMQDAARADAMRGDPSLGDVLGDVVPRRPPKRISSTAANSNFHYCVVNRVPRRLGRLDSR